MKHEIEPFWEGVGGRVGGVVPGKILLKREGRGGKVGGRELVRELVRKLEIRIFF